mgnify:CR=1 FL=1
MGGALSFNQHAFNLSATFPRLSSWTSACAGALRHGRWGALAEFEERLLEKAHARARACATSAVTARFLLGDRPGRVIRARILAGLGTVLVEFVLEMDAATDARRGPCAC